MAARVRIATAAAERQLQVELKQLRYFAQIVASGSFSAASNVLHIAQPALSRQVRALEIELGVTLFHRTGRGVTLTAAGQMLSLGALSLLDNADNVRRSVMQFRTMLSGDATIGLTPTVGRVLTLPLTQNIKRRYPHVNLRIAEGYSGLMLEWLQSGRIDAAVFYDDPRTSAIRADAVAREELAVVTTADDASGGLALATADLGRYPFILPTPNHGLRRLADAHAASAGIDLDIRFEIDALHSTIEAVKAGMGATILPLAAVADEIAAGVLAARPIVDPPMTRTLIVATAAQRTEAMTTRQLSRLLIDEIIAIAPTARWSVI